MGQPFFSTSSVFLKNKPMAYFSQELFLFCRNLLGTTDGKYGAI
jgi:hypothetical protein